MSSPWRNRLEKRARDVPETCRNVPVSRMACHLRMQSASRAPISRLTAATSLYKRPARARADRAM